jgi:YHS domain-containing protein
LLTPLPAMTIMRKTLYFCSIECLREFERDPAVYMDDMGDEERIA